ncbi:MAG TPA: CarD family transcriptional regulator [Candidatus Acidoferrum sp.]|nr:CarD family transcriptional regulator [Candidatus Acidoferrum sp.]
MVKSNDGKLHHLIVGSRVFYPSHGVGLVAGIEEREFGHEKQIFYVLELDRGVKVLLPRSKIAQAGVRELVTATKARELLEKVRTEPANKADLRTDHAARKERAATYADGLRSGSADRYTAILQELLFRSRTMRLSPSEQQTLETARSFFVGEIGAALKRSPATVEADLLAEAEP